MGSFKGDKTTTTQSSSHADPQAEAAYRSLISRAATVANTPYQAYSGELTAPINAQQQTAISNINANAGFAQPYIQQAAGLATDAANPISPEQIAAYQDPYTQSVIDATQAQFNNQNQQAQQGVLSHAAVQGALGGNRIGVAQANLAGQQQLAQAPVLANLRSQGYQQALAAAQADQQRKQAAAYSLGNLGVAGQSAALSGATAQLGAGTLQQQTQQAADTAQYGQYMQQQAYPFQTLQWLAGLQTGVGSQLGGTSYGTSTQPQPNSTAQWLGLGVSALGLLSDERAKEDIEHIGKMNDGQNIYRYRYKGSPEWHIGPIAQEVEQRHPESVAPGVAGLKFIDVKGATDEAAHAHGGVVGHFDSGGGVAGVPFDAAQGWVPKMNITAGRGAPSPISPSSSRDSGSGVSAEGIMKAATGLAGLAGKYSGEAYGGGNVFNSEWGGSSSQPLPGLDASDYGIGFRRGGGVAGFADGGTPFGDRWGGDNTTPGYDPFQPPTEVGDAINPFDPTHIPSAEATQEWREANPLPGPDGKPGVGPISPPVVAQDDAPDVPADVPPGVPTDLSAQSGMPGVAASPPNSNEGVGGFFHLSPAARAGLIAAGLGMMASRSPNLGNAIGEGGLVGFGTYAGVKKGEQEQAKTAQELAQKAKDAAEKLALETRKQTETERHNRATEGKEFKPTWGVIGEDPLTGIKQYGWINPNNMTTQGVAAPNVGAPGAGGKSNGPIDPGLTGDAFLAELSARNPQLAGTVKAIGTYKTPLTSLSVRGGHRERILGYVMQAYPDYDQTQFTGKNRAVSNFAGGPEGRTVRSLNVAIDHLNTLEDAARALQNGDIPALNRLVNYAKQQTGNPVTTNFDSIKQVVSAEIAKAVVGGQTALHDRDDMARRAANSQSPAQLLGITTEFKKLMAGQMKGLRRQYEATTKLKNFDDFLDPHTKKELEAVSGHDTATKPKQVRQIFELGADGQYHAVP